MDKKNKILEASLELFGKKGYFETDIESIAKRADVGKGTIYLYFKNKKDLFISTINYALNNCNEEILKSVEKVDTPSLKVERYMETFFNIMLGNVSKIKFFTMNNINSNNQISDFSKNIDKKIVIKRFQILKDIIEEGIEKKEFKDFNSEIMTMMIVGLIHMEISRVIFFETQIDQKRIKYLKDNVIKILSKE
uniref:TetR/AcrR family transcriptional regulator n=1 Tax=candidate division WOR-3 bacterium TaxID=2052148 RepID=A0A7C3J689_UNCW3